MPVNNRSPEIAMTVDAPQMPATAGRSAARPLGVRFWQLWTAASVSALGDGVAFVAFPLLATGLTHRPALIAGIAMAQRLPWLLVSLPAGAIADRVDRRRLMSSIDAVRMVLLLGLAALAMSGGVTLPLLYAAAFALGVFDTAYSAAAHSAVPALVARQDLDRANGYLFSARDGGEQLVGPALGGLLFAVAASLPLVVDGVSFGASALLLLVALRPVSAIAGARREPASAPSPRSTIRADVRVGVSFFVRSRPLRVLSAVIGGLAVCQAMVMSVLVLFALDILHLSKAGFGVFMGAAAIGNVAGGVIAARVRRRFGTSSVLIGAALAASAGYAGLALTRRPVVAVLLLVMEAVAVACGNVASVSFRQRVVPEELLGRVGNVFRMVIWGSQPLGALAGGLIAGAQGLPTAFMVAALVQTVVTVACARSLRRQVREVELIDLRPSAGDGAIPVVAAVTVPVAG